MKWLNKFSIRTRLVGITVFILVICCIGLTVLMNYSATQMASQVAQITTPAQNINEIENQIGSQQPAMDISESIENMESQQRIIDNFYRNSFLYMLFIIMIGGSMMYLFSKSILLPLAKLNDRIKNSTVSTLSDKLSVPNSDDEIAELTVSFNKMTDRIQEAFLFQQQFSGNVAHELRTPLTIMKTKIDVFEKRENHTPAEYKELILNQKNQLIRLSEIIQTILEITNTDIVQEKEYFLVSDMVENILLDFSNMTAQKNIYISTDLQNVEIYGNVDLLYRVFYNLIQNSIRYNEEKGSIYISAKQNQHHTTVQICDTGIGISAENRQRIFEPFFRVDKSRSREMGGAGLGLSIVKKIIEKHDGTITVSNNNPQGTCFTVELPLCE
ncbi:HAMP domain-containing histidine kinase [Faecalicatena sp. Marseille-Q4148]|nr:HAMP domain-containing histidine kinase [Faecalicatena sp. Marseille-Q4148]